jgi:hypothetical protein
MILPDLILPSRQNQVWSESGIDSYAECNDKKHFKSYPHKVEYRYNSRGFRDIEWPETLEELKECIWCFGDSFTVGIGSPIDHIWPNILQNKINCRCINISMDGASNNWIARKAARVLTEISPKYIVIHWSFFTRDEDTNNNLSDEARRLVTINDLSDKGLINHFKKSVDIIENNKGNCKVIHSFIPESTHIKFYNQVLSYWNRFASSSWPMMPTTIKMFNKLDKSIINEIGKDYKLIKTYLTQLELLNSVIQEITYLEPVNCMDLARDGYHYDIITATNFVEQLVNLISPSH